MAITKMVGSIDGTEIVFEKDGSGYWNATVPPHIYGEAVVEIRAYDEAGNYAYSANMLFIVTKEGITVQILSPRFVSVSNPSDRRFYHEEVGNNYVFEEVEQKYVAKVVR